MKKIRIALLFLIFTCRCGEPGLDNMSMMYGLKRNTYNIHSMLTNPYLNNPVDIYGHRPLDHFFESLLKTPGNLKIRIAHYGDSQIEGDRVTKVIRGVFQKKFGGSGIGFVPFTSQSGNKNYIRYGSRNWARYTVFHNRYNNRYYGPGGTVFKYLQVVVDSLKNDTTIQLSPENIDSVRYTYFNNASLRLRFKKDVTADYKNIFLMYGQLNTICPIKITDRSTQELLFFDTLHPEKDRRFNVLPLNIAKKRDLQFEFLSRVSPEFYGMLLDGDNGVQVDNFAIRGHSGDGLLLIKDEFIKEQFAKLNIKLIIFQYGMNTVPYYQSASKCEKLEAWYYDVFSKYRKLLPEVSILVVGPGDMARGGYSYRYLPNINQAIKNAAVKSGCAYWDVFEMMGGSNSIFEWTKKKLAVKNGHFTDAGQKYIGIELSEAILKEYDVFSTFNP